MANLPNIVYMEIFHKCSTNKGKRVGAAFNRWICCVFLHCKIVNMYLVSLVFKHSLYIYTELDN